jgi:hypothetical protein
VPPLLGWWVGRGCDQEARASLHTARLAVIGSSALFALLSLVLWSVVSFVASRAVPKDLFYLPIAFRGTYRSARLLARARLRTHRDRRAQPGHGDHCRLAALPTFSNDAVALAIEIDRLAARPASRFNLI